MQTAMRIQSVARNFPCCHRYVLHVSQMMLETSPMDLWTCSARVCLYCKIPNAAPMAQMTRPANKIAWPLKPPPKNETSCNDGRLMSASPAKAFVAQNIAAKIIAPRKNDLFLAIKDAQLAEAAFEFPAFSDEKCELTPDL